MIQKQNSFYINLHCFEFICIHMRPSLSVFIFDINIMMCPLSFLLFREINWKAIFGKLTMPSSSRASIMPSMEYIPKLKEVEGVEGGGPLTRLQYGKNTQ